MSEEDALRTSRHAQSAGAAAENALIAPLSVDEHVMALVWSPQGNALAVAGADGGVFLLDADPLPRLRRIGEHAGGALCVGFIRDGSHVVSGGQGDELLVHDRSHDDPPQKLPMPGSWIEHLCSSADGKWLAVAAGRYVQLYETDTLSLLHTYAPLPATVAGLAFAPRGRLLAAASYGGVQLLTPFAPYGAQNLTWAGACVALAWRPDASVIAAGGQDASVQFWRLPKAKHSHMSGYATKVRELSWDGTGRWLATGGGDVVLWDFKTGPEGRMPQMLHGHADRIVCLRWQQRGSLLASVSRDGVLMLWRRGHFDMPLKAFKVPFQPTALAWSPDDQLLAMGGDGGQLAMIKTSGIQA